MMTSTASLSAILSLLNDKYASSHKTEITPTTELLSSGLVDSISALELVADLEAIFGFEFAPHEVDRVNLDTAELILHFVLTKQSASED